MNKVVFLDRDGTLNVDNGYTYKPEDFQLLPFVADSLSKLKAAGFLLIVITNQSGIGRGYYTMDDVDKFHGLMQEELQKDNVMIDYFYICPHTIEEKCNCRKPSPYLLFKAFDDFNIDPQASFLIGDKNSDIQAGQLAGVKSFLITDTHSILHWANHIINVS